MTGSGWLDPKRGWRFVRFPCEYDEAERLRERLVKKHPCVDADAISYHCGALHFAIDLAFARDKGGGPAKELQITRDLETVASLHRFPSDPPPRAA